MAKVKIFRILQGSAAQMLAARFLGRNPERPNEWFREVPLVEEVAGKICNATNQKPSFLCILPGRGVKSMSDQLGIFIRGCRGYCRISDVTENTIGKKLLRITMLLLSERSCGSSAGKRLLPEFLIIKVRAPAIAILFKKGEDYRQICNRFSANGGQNLRNRCGRYRAFYQRAICITEQIGRELTVAGNK